MDANSVNSSDNFDDEDNENIENTLNNGQEEDEDEEEDQEDFEKRQAMSKEISAPYGLPHYPIEVEEQRKALIPHSDDLSMSLMSLI